MVAMMALSNRALKAASLVVDMQKDAARFAEIARMEAYQRGQRSAPLPVPAPSKPRGRDQELDAINVRMAEGNQLRRQQVANPVQFGPSMASVGEAVPPYRPLAETAVDGRRAPTIEDQIAHRVAMHVEQFTNPHQSTPGVMPYGRLEQTRADHSSPNYDTDPHVLRIQQGPVTWRVPVPGQEPPEAA
jgi:hypothetical protein